MVRLANKEELSELLHLYLYLHETSIPESSEHLFKTWAQIIDDPNHHIIVKVVDGQIVSSCVCLIVPNLTRGVRPYAIVENVVTHADYRGRGYAVECIKYAKKLAMENNCYKIMLSTGSKNEHILNMYKSAGFNSEDKTAFVMWL